MWNVEKLFPLITAEVQTAAGGSLEMVSSDVQSSSILTLILSERRYNCFPLVDSIPDKLSPTEIGMAEREGSFAGFLLVLDWNGEP